MTSHLRVVRVLDREGKPIEGAVLEIIKSSVPIPNVALSTDTAGEFRLQLPKGDFDLRVLFPDGSIGTHKINKTDSLDPIIIRSDSQTL